MRFVMPLQQPQQKPVKAVTYLALMGLAIMMMMMFDRSLVSAEAEAEVQSPKQRGADSASGTGSFILQQIKSYFEPAMDPKPQASLTNWEPEDRIRKQKLLRDAVDKTTVLIRNYQMNGLPNIPSLPSSIPGVGSVMKSPDKVYRAELSMLQDLIKMSQEMIQNPVTAMVNLPRNIVEMLSRAVDQLEQ